jgi:hypothetical protein
MATEIASPPRLRTDLIVSRQEAPAGPCFVLKDPRTRRFFRLREAEYSIARRLDGQTSLASVAATVAAELETEVSAATLVPFVEQLRRGGLLEGPVRPRAPARAALPGRPALGPLQGLRPDRLLDRLAARLGFFFTPTFVVGAASLIRALPGAGTFVSVPQILSICLFLYPSPNIL